MNSKFFRVAIVSLLFLAGACTKGDIASEGLIGGKYSTRVGFDVTIETIDVGVEVTPITTRGAEQVMTDLWYVLYDESGTAVPSEEGVVMRHVDYTNTVNLEEMLPVGDYTAVFLGFSNGVKPADQIKTIEAMGDQWLTTAPTTFANGVYYYHRGELKVTSNGVNKFDIPLKPIVGQFVLNLNMAQPSTLKTVKLIFDTPIYTSFNVDGTYGEPTNVAKELSLNRKFYSLPTVGDVASGKVEITMELVGGKIITREYVFENLPIKAGKITKFDLKLDLDYNNLGVINVDKDFEDATFQMTMLQDNEDPHLYGIYMAGGETDVRRSFLANAPLRVNLRGNELEVQFYSLQGISDVDIYMDIDGIEPFKVCHLDYMPALKEAKFLFALTTTAASYETITGKIIKLPAMPELKNENAKFIIKSKDPYFVNKIEPLKCRWICCFRNSGLPQVPAMTEMSPQLARQGLAVMLNMAYMFSTAEFEKSLYARQGKLYWTTVDNVVDTRKFYRDLLRIERLGMGLLQGGGGSYGILALSYYITGLQTYFEVPYTSTEVFLWFHEFSHILGAVDTGGNLNGFYSTTDKDKWVSFTSDIYVKLATQKELPVWTQDMTK